MTNFIQEAPFKYTFGTIRQELTTADTTQEACEFCDIPDARLSQFDRAESLSQDVLLTPALGMIIPGYFLAITTEHIKAFSEAGELKLRTIGSLLVAHEAVLSEAFGDYFRFEHGAVKGSSQCMSRAAACIEHAHQHLVPDNKVAEYILSKDHPEATRLGWEEISAYEELAHVQDPYLYIGYQGLHYVALRPHVQSQWMRRQFEPVHGIVHWDLGVYRGEAELDETFSTLKVPTLQIPPNRQEA